MTTHIRKTYGGIHQKAMIGAGLANLRRGGDRKTFKPSIDGLNTETQKRNTPVTQVEAAQKVGVTASAVYRANKVIEKGIDGLSELVTDKKISLSKACDIAKRDLTREERAFLGAKLANMKHGTNQYSTKVDASIEASTHKKPSNINSGVFSQPQAAKAVGSTRTDVYRAQTILQG